MVSSFFGRVRRLLVNSVGTVVPPVIVDSPIMMWFVIGRRLTVVKNKSPGRSIPTVSAFDSRIQILDSALRQHRYSPDALIEILHVAQKAFGHLTRELLWYVAGELKLPPSRVFGTATFYHLFHFQPKAEHTCVVCLGTACFVNGGKELLGTAEKETGLKEGQVTQDGRYSLQSVSCLGTCGIAPLAVIDSQIFGNLVPASLAVMLKGWNKGEPG